MNFKNKYTKLKFNTFTGGMTRSKGTKRIFFYPRYTSEAMGNSMVEVKADDSNDRSTARLTRGWANEPHGIKARIKYFDRRTTAVHLLRWLLWMRIK